MRRVLTCVVAASMLVLVGCSGSDAEGAGEGASADRSSTTAPDGAADPGEDPDGDEAEAEPGEPVEPGAAQSPQAWADDFCSSFSEFVNAINGVIGSGGEDVLPDDYEAQQQAIVDFLDVAAEEAASVASSLEDGGVPEVDRGDELVAGLVDRFSSLASSIEETRDAIVALAPDPATFEKEASDLLATFQEDISAAGASLTEIDDQYPSDELTDALASACAF